MGLILPSPTRPVWLSGENTYEFTGRAVKPRPSGGENVNQVALEDPDEFFSLIFWAVTSCIR